MSAADLRPKPVSLAVRLDNVSAWLGRREILSDVSLDLPIGSRLGIVGINGAGKSTLLRVIAGSIRPRTGQAFIADGQGGLDEITSLSARERARRLSFVPQEEIAAGDLFVGEMVALGRVPRTRPWSRGGPHERQVVTAALRAVGLDDRIDDPCDELSGGEKRRAVFARGLAQECPFMLLDEPTNHLDVAWQLRILGIASEQAQTLVATIHDLDLALRSVDLVGIIGWPPERDKYRDPATLVAFGPPQQVLTTDAVEAHFGVHAVQVPHPEDAQLSHLLIQPGKAVSR